MKKNVETIAKNELLAVLYNNAKPLGLGYLHYDTKPMSYEAAQNVINEECESEIICTISIDSISDECEKRYTHCYFDYLKGRVIKTDISKDIIDLSSYMRDNTHINIIEQINQLIEGNIKEIEYTEHKPLREDEYTAYYVNRILDLSNKINPYTQTQDLSSVLAMYDLQMKCKDVAYDDNYSKQRLKDSGLYPWENSDIVGIEKLCAIIEELHE